MTPAARHRANHPARNEGHSTASHGATNVKPSEVRTAIASLKEAIEKDDDDKVKELSLLLFAGVAINLAILAEAAPHRSTD